MDQFVLPELGPPPADVMSVPETVQILPNGYLEDAIISKIQDLVPLRVSGGSLVLILLVLFIRRLIASKKGGVE